MFYLLQCLTEPFIPQKSHLRALHRSWIPVARNWRLNERHYGALQGLDKSETAKIHGEDQVKVWRRSFDVPPPAVDSSDSMHPANDDRYKDIPPEDLPSGESLELTRDRVMPYFHKCIVPAVQEGRVPFGRGSRQQFAFHRHDA